MSKIYQGQTLKLLLDTGVDLTAMGATTTDLKVVKPEGGAELTWSGGIYSGDSQRVEYDCTTSDLDETGAYSVQTYIDDGVNGPWRGDTYTFVVHEKHT